jgi:dTDP-4-amino-4,6-dideoxygalactose transaminase
MAKIRKIQISVPSVGEDEWNAMKGSIDSGWLTQGPRVREFETNFAIKHEVEFALATTSCTTALHLMLAASGIGPGDEVIVPSFTWVSTANAVLYCGATPVLCDVDPITYNIDIHDAVKKITDKTRAIIAVHLFGLCADIPTLKSMVRSDVLVFEDAACAAGAQLDGVFAGNLGDAAAFSFHPRKSITTGEGGMLTTSNPELATKAEQMRNHGAAISEEERHLGSQPYLLPDFNLLGFNYRMTDLQGSIGVIQLAKLDSFIQERDKWAKFYVSELSDISWLCMPFIPPSGGHAWQSFVTRVDETRSPLPRNAIMATLQGLGIATRPGTHSIHLLNYYAKRFGYEKEEFPNSKLCSDTTMALPLHNKMQEEDYVHVVKSIRQITG